MKERKLKIFTGCKTYGFVNIMKQNCTDPTCPSCSSFLEAFQKELKKQYEQE